MFLSSAPSSVGNWASLASKPLSMRTWPDLCLTPGLWTRTRRGRFAVSTGESAPPSSSRQTARLYLIRPASHRRRGAGRGSRRDAVRQDRSHLACGSAANGARNARWPRARPDARSGERTEPTPEPDPEAGRATRKVTLRLVGHVPPELWNRLGTKLLPKLRSGEHLRGGTAPRPLPVAYTPCRRPVAADPPGQPPPGPSRGDQSRPWAAATAWWVTCPSTTLTPAARAGSRSAAARQPRSAISKA